MKVLIIGTGLMGTAFKSAYPEAILCGRKDLDITQENAIAHVIDPIAPDIMINCAAYTNVDKAESEQSIANQINGTAVGYLAKYAAKNDITLIHFSTDYVFDGQGKEPYSENTTPSPINAYGYSKWLGEQALAKYGQSTYLFRIQWIYGKNGNNFIKAITKKATETGNLAVVNDQWGSPTWNQDLAEKILFFLRITPGSPKEKPPYGIYHVASQGHTNWHDFAAEILSQTQIPSTLTAVTSDEMPRPAKRPPNGRLNCEKFARHAPLPLPWTTALSRYLHETGTQT
jgi:dTDP-4-dehydrorhamnose reductase